MRHICESIEADGLIPVASSVDNGSWEVMLKLGFVKCRSGDYISTGTGRCA